MTQPAWQERLAEVVELTQIMSRHLDPQSMVKEYSGRVRKMFPVDRWMSLSRRELKYPEYRITRYSRWKQEINPWKEKDKLPLLSGGLLAELIYSNQPTIIDTLEIDPSDPAAPYLEGQRSLMAIPMLDGGEALNMAISTHERTHGFDYQRFPEMVWLSNLFGRATHNLVLREEVLAAYRRVERELQVVGDIQRSLLPKQLPEIPGFELAVYYQTSQQAGGDYYDFFPLADGKWGLLIADVSGHGTPAAVMMAITHSIAHLYPSDPGRPGGLLEFVNRHLAGRYASEGTFVTAFYGIYDPATRSLDYASAGHNPPRLWKCRENRSLAVDGAANLPLGLSTSTRYTDASVTLEPGDRLLCYTDGITESTSAAGPQFGTQRLDEILAHSCRQSPHEIVAAILGELDTFTDGSPPLDDRSLVVGRVV